MESNSPLRIEKWQLHVSPALFSINYLAFKRVFFFSPLSLSLKVGWHKHWISSICFVCEHSLRYTGDKCNHKMLMSTGRQPYYSNDQLTHGFHSFMQQCEHLLNFAHHAVLSLSTVAGIWQIICSSFQKPKTAKRDIASYKNETINILNI